METRIPRSAQPMPKGLLIPVTKLIGWLSKKTNGLISVPEVADALIRAYDGDAMPIYDGGGYGLADEMGPTLDEVGIYNYRVDTICDVFNSRCWSNPDATIRSTLVRDIMVRKSDAQIIAKNMWARFFPDADFLFDAGELYDEPLAAEPAEQGKATDAAKPCGIEGPTFARLARAIAAFPDRYPSFRTKAPKLDADIRPWLSEAGLAENDAERRVFGAIVREHFKLSPDTQKSL